jgi:uncharacterized protein YqeY
MREAIPIPVPPSEEREEEYTPPVESKETEPRKESAETISELRGIRERLVKGKSDQAAEIAGMYLGGKLTSKEAGAAIENIPDRAELVKKSLDRLEQMGLVQWAVNPETKGRSLVIDTEGILSMKSFDVAKIGRILRSKDKGHREWDKPTTLYSVFRDLSGLSKNQLDRGDFKEKPVFHTPTNREDAFDIEQIRNSDFHLGLWDVAAGTPGVLVKDYPTKEGPSPKLQEVKMATILFHPRYGDAKRDNRGNLVVRDAKTREYRNISGDVLDNYGMSMNTFILGKGHGRVVEMSTRESIRQFFPNLVSRGLLRPDDFRILSTSSQADKERVVRTNVSPDGYVMINRVKHYLGREFYDRPIKVYELGDDLGGIAEVDGNGEENLAYTFRVFKREEAPKTKSGALIAGRAITEVAQFSPDKIAMPRRADETDEDYGARLDAAKNFAFTLKLSNDIAPLGVNIHKEDVREQVVIAKTASFLAESGKYNEFLSLAKKFGEDGVKAFFAAEYGNSNGEQILEIGSKLKESDAESLFYSFGRVIDASSNVEGLLRNRAMSNLDIEDDLKERFPNEVREAILRRTTDILMAAVPRGGKENVNPNEVRQGLEGVSTFFEILQTLEDTNTNYRIIKMENRGDTVAFLAQDKSTDEMYEMKIFVRPEENSDGQARINIELDFDTIKPNEELKKAFTQDILFKRKNKSKKIHRLRIAIDRDDYQGEPQVSLDFGRGPHDGETQKRQGDVVGRALSRTTELGYHNPKSFDRRFANPDTFSKIARALEEYLGRKSV